AGKTTLFRMLLGLNRPAAGELLIFGEAPHKGNGHIGYVPQRRNIDTDTKIISLEYVRLGLNGTRWGMTSPAQIEHEETLALQALREVDAEKFALQPLSQLSGGEQQRVFLAQALVGKPKLLLLDEPLANLDIRRETELTRLVHTVAKQHNIAVLLIAHDINPLLPFVDRIIYIAGGKVATGKPSEVITSQTLSALYNAPVEVLRDSKGRLAVLGAHEGEHHDEK
ncbi:MAG TPA: ATP-binding cassette domain-containing protein, partial [Candidatus Acidoferrum sp.]|nr:ATP-binding cassette domain-containing protein [Candidatus Acidoferrum sp.]